MVLRSDEMIRGAEIALNNKAVIKGIVAVSFPNGPGQHGTNRDLGLDLSEEQSVALYNALIDILKA